MYNFYNDVLGFNYRCLELECLVWFVCREQGNWRYESGSRIHHRTYDLWRCV